MDAIEFRLYKNEVEHINESLKTVAIPTPKTFIKDHTKLTRKEYLPTKLVIPATDFSATFKKWFTWDWKIYLGNNNINYTRFTIVQESHVKDKWEEFNWKEKEVPIASTYSVGM